MDEQRLELVEATEDLADAYAAFLSVFEDAGEGEIPGDCYWETLDMQAKIRRMREYARGENLPEGFVPATTYWLVRDGQEILGTVNLRHRLTEGLLKVGGHIGYSIRPDERGKGYGRLQCALALDKARALGLTRVLITCDSDNVASARVIEANGGVLADERVVEGGAVKKRYWVEL